MNDPQNGVDYLVDWYALLGVPRDAGADAIRKAYRDGQLRFHPDRYAHLAPEFQREAERRSRLLSEAMEALGDAASRADYDRLLAGWQGPVSEDGTPVISLDRPHFAPSQLFADPAERAAARAKLDGMALQMSGYDAGTCALLEKLAAAPGAAKDVVDACREALRRKDTYLQLLEAFLWEDAGFRNRPTDGQSPRAYLAAIDEELRAAKERVGAAVAETLLRLEGRGDLKLLGAGDAPGSGQDPAALAVHRERALERFDAVAAAIRERAREREAVIAKRLALVRGDYVPDQPARFPRLIVCIEAGSTVHCFPFRLVDSSVGDDPEVGPDDRARIGEPGEAERWIARGHNVMRLVFEEGIDFREQLEAAVLLHFESLPGPESP